MADFDTAVERTLAREGGYVNDPRDPGGATKYGISQRIFPDLDIAGLTEARARAIYHSTYWTAPGIYRLTDDELAARVFDLAVNIGQGRAIRVLQRACNWFGPDLRTDGFIGPLTANFCNNWRHPAALLAAVKAEAALYYRALNRPDYLAGWLNRLED